MIYLNGLFITVEGPDGSGKSTQIKLLSQYLRDNGHNILMTREPGGTPISEDIRRMILDNKNTRMSSVTEALLYSASRAQHVHEKIIPALEKGKVVICDRFVDSSLVYQGIGRNLGVDKIKEINDFATGGIDPDVTLFFDIHPELAFGRRRFRKRKDRLEKENIKFHTEVYNGYLKLSKKFPDRIRVIDATKDINEVFEDIKGIVNNILENKSK